MPSRASWTVTILRLNRNRPRLRQTGCLLAARDVLERRGRAAGLSKET
jgi:hypothetical protein